MSVVTKEDLLKEFDHDVAELRGVLEEGGTEAENLGYSLIAIGSSRTGALFNTNNMVLLIGAMTIEVVRQGHAFNTQSVLGTLMEKAAHLEAQKNPV